MRSLVIMIFMLFPLTVYADETVSLGDIADEISDQMSQMQNFLIDFGDLAVDCELEVLCIYEGIEARGSDTKNPSYELWQLAINDLPDKKLIAEYSEMCNIPPVNVVRKEITLCAKQTLDLVKSQGMDDLMNHPELAMVMTIGCINKKMTVLAEQDNVFALAVLKDLDSHNKDKWSKALENQKDSEFYELSQKCSSIPGLN